MTVPTITYLRDRVKLTGMSLTVASTYPGLDDEISDAAATSPTGYVGLDQLGDGERYPIVVIAESTGTDWFSCIATVNVTAGILYVTEVDNTQTNWTLGSGTEDVTVIVSVTSQFLRETMRPRIKEVADTEYYVLPDDNEYLIRFTSGSAVTVSLFSVSTTSPFRCYLVQEGAGTVTVDSLGLTTLNGGTSDVPLSSTYHIATAYYISNGNMAVAQ